jgi:hypothetical protein
MKGENPGTFGSGFWSGSLDCSLAELPKLLAFHTLLFWSATRGSEAVGFLGRYVVRSLRQLQEHFKCVF